MISAAGLVQLQAKSPSPRIASEKRRRGACASLVAWEVTPWLIGVLLLLGGAACGNAPRAPAAGDGGASPISNEPSCGTPGEIVAMGFDYRQNSASPPPELEFLRDCKHFRGTLHLNPRDDASGLREFARGGRAQRGERQPAHGLGVAAGPRESPRTRGDSARDWTVGAGRQRARIQDRDRRPGAGVLT